MPDRSTRQPINVSTTSNRPSSSLTTFDPKSLRRVVN